MSTSRDLFLIMLLLLLTGAVAFLGLQQRLRTNEEARGSIYNPDANGASLLAEQMAAWGYTVAGSDQAFLIQPDDAAYFVLGVNEEFSRMEIAGLQAWVQGGGTLLVAQDGHASRLLQQFGLDLSRSWRPVNTAVLHLPAFNWPPIPGVTLRARHKIDAACGQVAVHMGDCRAPLLVATGYGNGQVIVVASPYPFTNEGLQQPGNLQFAQNLIGAAVPDGATIRMDETHRQAGGLPRAWLVTTPEGLAILYTLLLLLAFFWWQGRALQTTVMAAHDPPRESIQSTDEFINELANLYQHGRQEKNIQLHYWQRLKRQLARKYRCDFNLPDHEFLAQLMPFRDELDMPALVGLQADLQRHEISESHLVWWVTKVIAQTDKLKSYEA